MKNTVIGAGLALAMTLSSMAPAFAGGLGEAEVESDVFAAADTQAAGLGSLGGGAGLAILGLIVVGAALASSGDS